MEIFQVVTDPIVMPSIIDALLPTIITTFIGVATAAIGFIGFQVRKFIASQANNEHADFLSRVAEIAVQAIEQTYSAANGDEKKQAAINAAERLLESRGVKVDLDVIEDAIEAAVLREFNYPAAVTPADPPAETFITMSNGTTGPDTE